MLTDDIYMQALSDVSSGHFGAVYWAVSMTATRRVKPATRVLPVIAATCS